MGCTVPPILVARIDYYFSGGVMENCCEYDIEPAGDAESGTFVVDCFYAQHEVPVGEVVTTNPDESCACRLGPPALENKIDLFADVDMSACGLVDDREGVVSVYAFHMASEGVTAVEFSAPLPECWEGATWVGDYVPSPFLSLGNSQSGLSIAYTRCEEPPIYVARIDYLTTGAAQTSCIYQVTPDATRMADCEFEMHNVAPGSHVVINPSPSNPCHVSPPTPARETTWGRVKAMFR
jgi:hypothetical protein